MLWIKINEKGLIKKALKQKSNNLDKAPLKLLYQFSHGDLVAVSKIKPNGYSCSSDRLQYVLVKKSRITL